MAKFAQRVLRNGEMYATCLKNPISCRKYSPWLHAGRLLAPHCGMRTGDTLSGGCTNDAVFHNRSLSSLELFPRHPSCGGSHATGREPKGVESEKGASNASTPRIRTASLLLVSSVRTFHSGESARKRTRTERRSGKGRRTRWAKASHQRGK
jgi:hypothetical protein